MAEIQPGQEDGRQQRVVPWREGRARMSLHTHMLSKSCLYCSSPRPPSTSLSSLRRISSSNCGERHEHSQGRIELGPQQLRLQPPEPWGAEWGQEGLQELEPAQAPTQPPGLAVPPPRPCCSLMPMGLCTTSTGP